MRESTPKTTPLQRGSACLTCRRRKLRCDAGKPACSQCIRLDDGASCEYDNGKSKSRTQVLQDRIKELEGKIDIYQTSEQRRELAAAAAARAGIGGSPAFSFPNNWTATATDGYGNNSADWSTTSHDSDQYSTSFNSFMPGMPTWTTTPPSYPQGTTTGGNNWWDQEELPQNMRNHLINIILNESYFRSRVDLEFFVPRLLAWTEGTKQNVKPPHPALLNAIYLLACQLSSDPALPQHQPIFLSRTRKAMNESLAHVDRLLDYIAGAMLLVLYYIRAGRILEAHVTCATAARLAISCKLHRITSKMWSPSTMDKSGTQDAGSTGGLWEGALIEPPRGPIEVGARLSTFWWIFRVDRAISVMTGLPSSFLDEEIDSLFPNSLEDFETGQYSDTPRHTVRSLYVPDSGSVVVRNDSRISLRTKAFALLHRACRLALFNREADAAPKDIFWHTFHSADTAISTFIHSLPPVTLQEPAAANGGLASSSELAYIHIQAHVAAVQLHNIFAAEDANSYDKCLRASLSIKDLVMELEPVASDPETVTMFGLPFSCVFVALNRENQRLHSMGQVGRAAEGDAQMAGFLRVLRRMQHIFIFSDIDRIRLSPKS